MDPFIGQIIMFAGNFAPSGWALCDGQLLPIAQNTALFSLLGTTYGGDGKTNFALPDLRGRVPVHPGQGPGLSMYELGQQAGSETVTLTSQEIPAHTHSFAPGCSTQLPNTESPANAVPANLDPTQAFSTEPNGNMRAGNSSAAGGSQAHGNLQPLVCVNFIIALQGIYPSRN
jgi:microcystin-dependent protein